MHMHDAVLHRQAQDKDAQESWRGWERSGLLHSWLAHGSRQVSCLAPVHAAAELRVHWCEMRQNRHWALWRWPAGQGKWLIAGMGTADV